MELKKTRRQSSIRQSQPDFSEMNDEELVANYIYEIYGLILLFLLQL